MPQVSINLIHDLKHKKPVEQVSKIFGLRTSFLRAWIFTMLKVLFIASFIHGSGMMVMLEENVNLLDQYIRNDFGVEEQYVRPSANHVVLEHGVVASATNPVAGEGASDARVAAENTIVINNVQNPSSALTENYVDSLIRYNIENSIAAGFLLGGSTNSTLRGCLYIDEDGKINGTGRNCRTGSGGGGSSSSASLAIGSAVTGATQGSVFFAGAGGVLTEDNAAFNYNEATDSLYIGCNITVAGLAGGGTQCLQVDNNGDVTATGAVCGSGGSGDNTSVNGAASVDLNFVNSAASGTAPSVTWTLNTVPNPDEVSIAIGVASATEAGVVTTGSQTFAGNKTFNGSISASNLSGTNTGDQTITLTGDINGSGTGSFATTIQPDAVALSTDTVGNYVQSITNGSGISGANGGSEGAALTLALGALTADWNQTGAFDVTLNNASSELRILESAGASFYGVFDVADLSVSDKTYTFPNASGTVITTGNLTDITGLTDSQISDTLTASNFVGSGSSTNAIDLGTLEVDGVLGIANGGTGAIDPTAARGNLGLGTAATYDVGTSAGELVVVNGSGKIDSILLPSIPTNTTYVVGSEAAMLATGASVGDVAIRTDESKTYILVDTPATDVDNWEELLTPTSAVDSVAGKTGTVILTADDITSGTFSDSLLSSNVILADGSRSFTGAPTWSGTPTNGNELVNKDYADALAQGLLYKESARVATTANITLSGLQTIDGVSVQAGDRVLVKNQGTPSQNGLYTAAAGAWSRTTDADANDEVRSGMFVFILQGTTNTETAWVLATTGTITLGSTSLNFVQYSTATNGQKTNAGDGLVKQGNTIDAVGTANRIQVTADAIDISSSYIGQTSITTLGTITTGTWQGTAIAVNKGGTNITSYTTGDMLYATGGTTLAKLAIGSNGQCLTSNGTAPVWGSCGGGGGMSIGGSITSATQGSILFAGASGVLAQDNSNFYWDDSSNEFGIGTGANPLNTFHVQGTTTPQMRVAYDSSNYYTTAVSSAGTVTYDATGSSAGFIFSDAISSPGVNFTSQRFGQDSTAAGADAVAFGYTATASANNTIAIGGLTTASGIGGVAVGYNVTANSNSSVALGMQANALGSHSIAIGGGANTGANANSIVIGYAASATGANQFVVGGSTGGGGYITDMYLGNGVTGGATVNATIHATGGSGPDIAGANLGFAGGQGTGAGNGGNVLLQVAYPTASSSTLNTLTSVVTLNGDNNNSSGTQNLISLTPAVNQSGTAGYTALLLNTTETATGSGTKLLFDAQVGGSSMFSVTNAGVITSAALVSGGTQCLQASSTGVISGTGSACGAGGGGMAIGGSITSGTQGSVLFAGASGVLAQDNTNFFWNDTDNRLGIGTSSPSAALSVGAQAGQFPVSVYLAPSAHATSERVTLAIDNWQFNQDLGGNGTINFAIWDVDSSTNRVVIDANGNFGVGTDSTPNAMFNVGNFSEFQVNSSGAIAAVTGITSSGNYIQSTGTMALTTNVTTGTGTSSGLSVAANSLSSGAGVNFASSSVSTGSVVNLASTSAAANSNTQKVLNVTTSGANSNSTQTTYGGFFSNTHTGTSSTNVAAYFTASGGTNNYAAIFDAGNVGIGETTPEAKLEIGGGYVRILDTGAVTAPTTGDGLEFTASNDAAFINSYNRTGAAYQVLNIRGSTVNINSGGAFGNVGISTSAPGRALEINSATGNNLRLTYDDADGAPGNYAELLMSSSGDLTIAPSGGDTNITGNLIVSSLTSGGTQCLQASSTGVISGTGSACGGGSASLQGSYNGGATIATSGSNIGFTLNGGDDFTITTAANTNGFTTFSLADGSNASPPAQLVLINNADTNQALSVGLAIQSAVGTISTAIDVSDTDIGDAINLGPNGITGFGYTINATSSGLTLNATSSNLNLTTTTAGSIVLNAGGSSGVYVQDTIEFGGVTTDIITGTDEAFTILPTGTGDTILNVDSNTNVQVAATGSAPTVDMFTISNAGQNITTDGVDGLALDFRIGNGANPTNSAIKISMLSFADVATDVLNGIDMTMSGNSGTENGIRFGSNFDAHLTTINGVDLLLDSDPANDILLGGGSSSTGCTLDNATGDFTCTGTITGSGGGGGMSIGGSITSATQGSILFAGASGVLAQDNSNFFWDDSSNEFGIGTGANPLNTFHIQGTTTPQMRVAYDGSNYYTTAVSSAGEVTLDATGSSAGFTFNDNISIPGGNFTSQHFGLGSVASGGDGVAVGYNANVTASNAIGIGSGATVAAGHGVAVGWIANAGGISSVAIGSAAAAGANRSIAIGSYASTGAHAYSIAMGYVSSATAEHQFVVGGSAGGQGYITDMYIGNGVTESSTIAATIHGSGGSGSNVAGANLGFAGGQGTGSGNGGNVLLQVAYPTASSSTLNTLTSVVTLNGDNNNSSGTQSLISLTPTVNQSGTAGYTALLLNATQTATGSGTKLLFDAQVGGSSMFSVSNAGSLTSAALTSGGTQCLQASSAGVISGTGSACSAGGGMSIGGSITSATAGSMLFAGASGVLSQDNANLFWDDSSNELGIGTNAPNANLTVLGTARVGNDATGQTYEEANYGSTILGFANNMDYTSTSGFLNGGVSSINFTPSGSSSANMWGFSGSVYQTGSNNSTGQIAGIAGSAGIDSTGSANSLIGGQFDAYSINSTTVDSLRGSMSTISIDAGSVTAANALQAGGFNDGTLGTYSGLYVGRFTGSGTTTNTVGIQLQDQIEGTTSNVNLLIKPLADGIPTGNYSIYNSSTDDNYFAGNLGIGATAPGTNFVVGPNQSTTYKAGQMSVDGLLHSSLEGGAYIGKVGVTENSWATGNYGTNWGDTDTTRFWNVVTMSSNGKYQLAGTFNSYKYISSDYGATWAQTGHSAGWYGVGMSADGKIQVSTEPGGQIYTSYDYGLNWTAQDSNRGWRGVAASADGKYMTAVVDNGQIYRSTDFGDNWTAVGSTESWYQIAMSSDGKYQTAVGTGEQVYRSWDYGATWTAEASAQSWFAVAVSSDGKTQAATAFGDKVYVSYDYGDTWTGQDSNRNWRGVAMSADGRIMAAATSTGSGEVYVSTDYGDNWTLKTGSRDWYHLAMSSDGKIITGATYGNSLRISYADNYQSGNIAIGTSTTNARLTLAGNLSKSAWGLSGIQLQAAAATYTDSSTAGSGTATNAVFNSFAQPTLAATNSSVTTTNAATLYVAAAPTAGTNMTITNAYSLWVDAGTTRLDGTLNLSTITGSTQCLQVDTNGNVAGSGGACGGGGGMSIGGSITSGTEGSILFAGASGVLAQDNSNFFWDDSNNKLGLGVNSSLTGKLHVVGSITTSGASAVAGTFSDLTLTNGTASGFQFGNRLIATVNGATAGTEVGQLIRMIDNTTLNAGQDVRGLEVQAYSGTNVNGTNTGIASYGYTFGIQGITTAQAASQATPAGVYAELDNGANPTVGNALRAYTDAATSADLVAFTQDASAFTGTGLAMDFGNNSGSFDGYFMNLKVAGVSKFTIDEIGAVTIGSNDLGNGAAGPVLTLGRNTNGTNTGAGSVNFQSKAGTAGYVWQDNAGNLRIHTAAPTNANDTAGTVVGAQTSTRETKQDITDYTDYAGALSMVVDAPLHTFRYINDVQGYGDNSDLAKTRIGYIADEVSAEFMWGNVIDQVSVNGILMASVKELDKKINEFNTAPLSVSEPAFGSTTVVLQSHLYLSEDSVGQAKILEGDDEVRITFSKPYEYQPIATITPEDFIDGAYRVTDVDSTGFTIELQTEQNDDVVFNWHAFAGEAAKLTVSDGSSSNIVLVIPNQDEPDDSGEVLGGSDNGEQPTTPEITEPETIEPEPTEPDPVVEDEGSDESVSEESTPEI